MRLLEGVLWSAIRGWGSRGINLAVFFVSARYLSPAEIGVFSLVAAYLVIFQVLGEGGLADYIVQRLEENHKQDSVIFFTQVSTSLSIAALLVLISPWVAPLLIKHPEAPLIFTVMAITIPMTAILRVPEALLRKQLRFKALAMRGLITSAVAGVIGVTMAVRGYGVWALIVKSLVEVFVDAVAIYSVSRWVPLWISRGDRPLISAPYAYGKHLLGARLIETFFQRIDTLLIGHFLGNSALGFYSVGQKIYQALIELLSKVFSNVAVPYMAKEKGSSPALQKVYFDFLNLVSIFAFPIFTYIFMYSHELILLLFGQTWAESAWILRAFCLLGAINCVIFFNGPVLIAMGDSKAYLKLMIQRTLILIGLCLAGLNFGLPGVVTAMVIGGIVIIPLAHIALKPWMAVSAKEVLRQLSRGMLIALMLGIAVAILKAMLERYALMIEVLLSGFLFVALLCATYYAIYRNKGGLALLR